MWKGYKMEKDLHEEYSHVALLFPGRVRDTVSTVQRTEVKGGQEIVFMTPYEVPKGDDYLLYPYIITSVILDYNNY